MKEKIGGERLTRQVCVKFTNRHSRWVIIASNKKIDKMKIISDEIYETCLDTFGSLEIVWEDGFACVASSRGS